MNLLVIGNSTVDYTVTSLDRFTDFKVEAISPYFDHCPLLNRNYLLKTQYSDTYRVQKYY